MATDRTESIPPPVKPKRRFRMTWKTWLIAGLAVALVAGAGVGTWMLLQPKATGNRGAFTQTAQATLGTQTQSVSLEGTLSPSKQSNVSFTVSGTVTSVKVKAGDVVEKGQKLATIDDSSLADAVDLASIHRLTLCVCSCLWIPSGIDVTRVCGHA